MSIMNTEQNYSEGDDYATSPPRTAQNTPLDVREPDERQIMPITAFAYQHLDTMLRQGKISLDHWRWSSIIPTSDDAMFPQLMIGGAMVIRLLDPTEYYDLTGKIVAVYSADTDTYTVGRVINVGRHRVQLKFDNKAFDSIEISRKRVDRLYLVTHSLFNPVL